MRSKEALEWYRKQSPELPTRILAEIAAAVDKLHPFPEAFHMVFAPYRRIALTKFPYSLFFRVDSEVVYLVAFFHQQSDPRKWKELLARR